MSISIVTHKLKERNIMNDTLQRIAQIEQKAIRHPGKVRRVRAGWYYVFDGTRVWEINYNPEYESDWKWNLRYWKPGGEPSEIHDSLRTLRDAKSTLRVSS